MNLPTHTRKAFLPPVQLPELSAGDALVLLAGIEATAAAVNGCWADLSAPARGHALQLAHALSSLRPPLQRIAEWGLPKPSTPNYQP